MILHRFTQLHQAPRALGRRLLSAAAPAVSEIKTVGCVGLGLMGHGIAQLSASAGYGVVAVETSEAAIEVGRGRIETSLRKLLGRSVKKGKLTEGGAAVGAPYSRPRRWPTSRTAPTSRRWRTAT